MHAMTHERAAWYRQPWPWLLMAGPAGVIAAGVVTMWLAFTHEDGLVADDYYKQGLAINRVIARDAAAQAIRIVAGIQFRSGTVRISLTGDAPPALTLSLVHPTRAGQDRVVRLKPLGHGHYEGVLEAPAQGRWHLVLGDSEGRWRLTGDWSPASGSGAMLVAIPDAERP